jgi:hypothetical protein
MLRRAIWSASTLLALALLLGGVLAFGPHSAMPSASLVSGVLASAAIVRFHWTKRRSVRAVLGGRLVARGRIREGSLADGRVLLDLPGGLEPWTHDAWALLVTTLGAVWLTNRPEWVNNPVPLWVVAALIGLMGLRLLAVGSDRIHLELEQDAWSVEAVEAGQAVRRAGRGPLRPELTSEGLILWCAIGRVGSLGRELEPAEGRWLAQRLDAHFAASRSTEPADSEINQQEPGNHGQRD